MVPSAPHLAFAAAALAALFAGCAPDAGHGHGPATAGAAKGDQGITEADGQRLQVVEPPWLNAGDLSEAEPAHAHVERLASATANFVRWHEVVRRECPSPDDPRVSHHAPECDRHLRCDEGEVPFACTGACGCIESPPSGAAYLRADTLGFGRSMCDGQPHSDEPFVGRCSGFLVAPTLLATAGHCFESEADCREMAFVFDYAVEDLDAPGAAAEIDLDSVHYCRRVLMRDHGFLPSGERGPDYGLIELDRPVRNRTPLVLGGRDIPEEGQAIAKAGHPEGLPVKLSFGTILAPAGETHWATDLRLTGGFSGGPVVDLATGWVEGINSRVADPHHKLRLFYDGTCTRFGLDVRCLEAGACPSLVQRTTPLRDVVDAWMDGAVRVLTHTSRSDTLDVADRGAIVAATVYVEFDDRDDGGEAVVHHGDASERLSSDTDRRTFFDPHRVYQTLRDPEPFGDAAGTWRVDTLGRPLAKWELTLLLRSR